MPAPLAPATQARRLLALLDALEPRRLMSGSAVFTATSTVGAEVVSLRYRGATVEAVKNSFVAVANSASAFTAAAAKAGFTAVTPLGGSGFFSFTSNWSASRIDRWAAAQSSVVQGVSPNFVHRPDRTPNDTLYSSLYAMNNTGQTVPNPSIANNVGSTPQIGVAGVDMNLPRAWDITTGASNIVIAVLDTGIDTTHPDLVGNLWVNTGEVAGDGIDNDNNGYVDDVNGYNTATGNGDVTDTDGHGTAAAGNIAATGDNNLGVTGASWSSKLMTLKIFDSEDANTTAAALSALNYVLSARRSGVNVRVVNGSFGIFDSAFGPAYRAAISRLGDAGVLYVASAGNDSLNVDRISRFPQKSGADLKLDNLVVVAATDNQDKLATFSNFGAISVDVAAPGVDILTTAPRFQADGVTPFVTNTTVPGYQYITGTSFSAPLTAGVAALAFSAYPQATPAQVRAAIIEGVDVLPSLVGTSTRAPFKVASGGRVDAYNTLREILNRPAGVVSTLQGNWKGSFGATAAFVYGGTAGAPTFPFLTGSLTPGTSAVVGPARVNAGDTRLAQNTVDSGRSTFYLYDPNTVSLPFDFGTTTQRLTLYVADVERLRVSQSVSITDTDTGRVLQTVQVSNFRDGRYLSFDLTGRVTVTLAETNNRGVVLNAVFLDPTPANPGSLDSVDTLTRGNWLNTYGDLGYVVPGTDSSLPAFVSFSPGTATLVTPGTTRNVLAPETLTAAPTTRVANVYTSATGAFDVAVNVTDGSTRRVSFYTYNTASTARGQRFAIVNPTTGVISNYVDATLAPRSGQYVTLELAGNNTIRISSLGGGDATLAGVFVSTSTSINTASPNKAAFVGSDSTTRGNYRGRYGVNGAFVVGASTAFPSFVSSTPTPVAGTSSIQIVSSASRDARAPLNPNLPTLRSGVVGYLATQSSYDLNLNLTSTTQPGNTSRVTAYFVDFDRKNRSQRVEIIDAANGNVLSSQVVRSFTNGKYLTWDVTGNVTLRITSLAGPSAVLSAVLFDA